MPVFPVRAMVPGSNFGHRIRTQSGASASHHKVPGAIFEYVDDVTHREDVALNEEVAMAVSSARLLLLR